MNKIDLLVQRHIALLLNAEDKLKTMCLVSKSWNKLIYSGFAWQSLFDEEYDEKWRSERITQNLFEKFTHFKGIITLSLPIHAVRIQFIFDHIDEVKEFKLANVYAHRLDELMKILRHKALYNKISNIPWKLSRVHVAAYWSIFQELQEFYLDPPQKGQEIQPQKLQFRDVFEQTPLHYYCKNPRNTVKELKIALQFMKWYINSKDKFSQTPMHCLAEYTSDPKSITLMVQSGANIQKRNIYFQSPLYYAGQNCNNLQTAKTWINLYYKSMHFQKDYQSFSPQIYAILFNQNDDVIKEFINRSKSIPESHPLSKKEKIQFIVLSSLMLKVAHNENFDPQQFLQNGNSIQGCRKLNYMYFKVGSPILLAVQCNTHLTVFKKLLKIFSFLRFTDKFSQNSKIIQRLELLNIPISRITNQLDNQSLAYKALKVSNYDILRYLITQRIDDGNSIFQMTTSLDTPLKLCVKSHGYQATKIMLQGCKNISPTQRTIILNKLLLIAGTYSRYPRVIKLLIDQGAQVNCVNNESLNEKDLTFYNKFEKDKQRRNKMLKIIQSNIVNFSDQNTPLHNSASLNQYQKITQIILKSGGNVNAKNQYKRTPLHQAIMCGRNEQVVKMLIYKGADVNAGDSILKTPMHYLVQKQIDLQKFKQLASFLMQHGANIELKDNLKQSPLDIVEKYIKQRQDVRYWNLVLDILKEYIPKI